MRGHDGSEMLRDWMNEKQVLVRMYIPRQAGRYAAGSSPHPRSAGLMGYCNLSSISLSLNAVRRRPLGPTVLLKQLPPHAVFFVG